MKTHIFLETLRTLTAIPEADRKTFASIANDLSETDKDVVIAQLITLNADLQKNDQKHLAQLQRGKEMVERLEDDVETLQHMTHA